MRRKNLYLKLKPGTISLNCRYHHLRLELHISIINHFHDLTVAPLTAINDSETDLLSELYLWLHYEMQLLLHSSRRQRSHGAEGRAMGEGGGIEGKYCHGQKLKLLRVYTWCSSGSAK